MLLCFNVYMRLNLPTILPVSSGAVSGGISSRAQNFSVSKLQQNKDRENAKVSLNQVMRAKTGDNTRSASSPAITSIAHLGQAVQSAGGNDGSTDEARDRLRWQHIRQLMRAKKATEEATARQTPPSKYQVAGMGTGSAFSRHTPAARSAERMLYKKVKQERATLKNISAKDRKYFIDLAAGHAKKVQAGAGFGRNIRVKMKGQVERDRQKGVVSKADADDFKKMINELPH